MAELHEDSKRYLAEVANLNLPAGTAEQVRVRYKTMCLRFAGPRVELPIVEDLATPVPSRLYAEHPDTPILVWFHGGRMISGDLDTHDALCRHLAARSSWQVLSVNYRMAPEHPWPAAEEDAMAAVSWARERASRVAVGGDSAGAWLAVTTAHLSAAMVLAYPMLDAEQLEPSNREFENGPGMTTADVRMGYELWRPQTRYPAHDFGSLPPAYVMTSGFDPLRDEGLVFAEHLRRDGKSVVHSHYADQLHGFLTYPALFRAAHQAYGEMAGFLQTCVRL